MLNQGISRGLTGKARRAHTMTRSSRWYAQRLIEDFFEPEVKNIRLENTIPVRRCAPGYLPTTEDGACEKQDPAVWDAVVVDSPEVPPLRETLRLPPEIANKFTEPKQDGKADRSARAAARFQPRYSSETPEPKPEEVIRSRKYGTSQPFEPLFHDTPQRSEWTLGGVLYGCALGAAAAAAVLLIAQLTRQ